jgi:uncharacterized protein (DUF2132 family)
VTHYDKHWVCCFLRKTSGASQSVESEYRVFARRDVTVTAYAVERYGDDLVESLRHFLQDGDLKPALDATEGEYDFSYALEKDVRDNYPEIANRSHYLWASRQRNFFG